MSSLQQLIESTIKRDKIDNWFVRYPWLTGHLSKRGPRHPDRIAEFKTTIQSIAKEYGLHEGESGPQG